MRAFLLSALLSVFWLASSRPAEACSPPAPGIHKRAVFPPNEATAVPTNARVVVSYTWVSTGAEEPAAAGIGMREVGGAAVDSTIAAQAGPGGWTNQRHFILTPKMPLATNTTYEVFDTHPTVPCGPVGGSMCTSAPGTVFAKFTTGADADMMAPQFEGIQSLVPQTEDRCNNSACCGPYHVIGVRLGWNAATDSSNALPLRYNLYRNGELLLGQLSDTQLSGSQVCSGGGPFGVSLPPGLYSVRAVDVAGNEAANAKSLELEQLCGSVAGGDAGAAGDAGMAPDAMADPLGGDARELSDASEPDLGDDDADSGCSCRIGARSSASAFPAWILGAAVSFRFLIRRRRRRG